VHSKLRFWNGRRLLACWGFAGTIVFITIMQWGIRSSEAQAAQEPMSAAVAHQPADELIPIGSRVPAPDFTLTDVQGRKITLSEYKGKVVLLDFWATTCGGCKIELPWYVEFDQRYRTKGLALIGIDMYGESAEIIRPFMVKWHMDYPVLIGSDALGDQFSLREMPLTLLIDRTGRIAVSHAGIVDRARFESEITELLR
jgi:thiol-disulfide isomerase/thioredoxin